jgi:threonine aldolase
MDHRDGNGESQETRAMGDPAGSDLIDLRSDTVTRPDAEMRQAMAVAVVGDDAYGEDPTVRELEEESAEALGREAALFVPSGTMGNQIAMRLLCAPGREVICEGRSHIIQLELGALAALSGLLPRTLETADGLLDPAAVEAAVNPDVPYKARTGLIVVENTHNLAGGTVYDRERLAGLLAVARRHRLPIHLDGARIWNAAAALGAAPAALAAGFDTVMFCLSKGLGAPVGSLLCGEAGFIAEARRMRKMLGGGMRQAGVLAAAGLVALRKGPARLAEDHANAALLARAVAELPGVELDPGAVRTNIVVFRLVAGVSGIGAERGAAERGTAERGAGGGGDRAERAPADVFLARLRAVGVLGSAAGRDQVRLVTHRDAPRPLIEEAIRRLRAMAAQAA